MLHKMYEEKSSLKDVLFGVAGGIAATWVMDKAMGLMSKTEGEEARKKEEGAGGGEPATEVLARRIFEKGLKKEPTEEAQKKLGKAIHWGYGAFWGGVLGAAHGRVPALTKAGGLVYGAAMWAVADEGATTVFRLTPPPQEYPLSTHVRALLGHLVYGATAEGVFHSLRKATS